MVMGAPDELEPAPNELLDELIWGKLAAAPHELAISPRTPRVVMMMIFLTWSPCCCERTGEYSEAMPITGVEIAAIL